MAFNIFNGNCSGAEPELTQYPTLADMAGMYRAEAQQISAMLRPLRKQLRECLDRDEANRLSYRIRMLSEALTQANDLTELCERYYDPGYCRPERYSFQRLPKSKCMGKLCAEDDLDALFDE